MNTALMDRSAPTVFSRDQIELIKRTIAKDATDDELKLFLAQCERTGLDPFDRQIYFIKRRQKNKKTGQYEEIGQTQTSIDGFRVVAERTGEMDGQDVAWCDEAGAWSDVWLKKSPPCAARVIAYRKGCAHGFPGIAKYEEYAQTFPDGNPSGLWGKMPANMLAKCAEALALRKAFPKQLSGLYTADEMAQAHQPEPVVTEPARLQVQAPQQAPSRSPAMPASGTSSVPNDAETSGHLPVIDTESGEELPELPNGVYYLTNYTIQGIWHEADLLQWDSQGGALHISTKRPAIANLMAKASNEHLPVCEVDVTAKRNSPGCAYVNALDIWHDDDEEDDDPEPPPLTDDDIPFLWLLPWALPLIGWGG